MRELAIQYPIETLPQEDWNCTRRTKRGGHRKLGSGGHPWSSIVKDSSGSVHFQALAELMSGGRLRPPCRRRIRSGAVAVTREKRFHDCAQDLLERYIYLLSRAIADALKFSRPSSRKGECNDERQFAERTGKTTEISRRTSSRLYLPAFQHQARARIATPERLPEHGRGGPRDRR